MGNGQVSISIRDRSTKAEPGASCELLVFWLGEQRYALPLNPVQRIERAVAVTALPAAPEAVLGIVNVRGQVVPVFNLRRRFRLPERPTELTDRLVVARTRHRLVAFLAYAVQGLLDGPAGRIISPEQVLPGLEYLRGVVRLQGGMVLIHDLDEFLSVEEEQRLNEAMQEPGLRSEDDGKSS